MQASGALNQIQPIKTALINSIISECNRLRERIYFTRPVVLIYRNNPLSLCSIYGIENNIILFDSPDPNLNIINYDSLPIESLVSMKEEIENIAKVNEITSRF